ncbi:MAG: hypothetical protein E7266_01495 [Lachnospiraceae bacterium]|nr:hypothetical protein [Lachnospiraceae bacterium]
MKNIVILICKMCGLCGAIVIFLLNSCNLYVQAADSSSGNIFDFSDAQSLMDEYTDSEFNISDSITDMQNGESTGWLKKIYSMLKDNITKEIAYNKDALVKVMFIALGTAVLTNFSSAFGSEGASEVGTAMSYIILTGYLFAGFGMIYNVALETVGVIENFMNAMVPAYFLSMGISGSATSAAAFYEIALFVVTIVCKLVGKFMIPAVMIYVVILIVNNIYSINYLSKLADLIRMVVLWGLKTMMGVVLGINVIQGIILPSVDAVKGKTVTKIVKLIPTIGNSAGTVADLIIGSGMVIKNAVGTTMVIGLILICSIPILKIVIYVLMYKVAGALIQPITDGRINDSVDAVTEGGKLLLQTTLYSMSLFAAGIAIICIATNYK